MSVVLDCSIAGCWSLPDETSELANITLELLASEEMIVPGMFWYEIRNILVVNERLGRIGFSQTEQALARISAIPGRVDALQDSETIMRLARKHLLTVYDAAYLELALRTGSRLATLDQKLHAAAASEGVPLVALG